jgi:hypothetical protein
LGIEYGSRVLDKNDRILGTVNHVIRNTWRGEIGKFVVRRKESDRNAFTDFFISPQNVLQVTEDRIKLNVTAEELSNNA